MEIMSEVAYFIAVAMVGGITGLSRAKFDRRKFSCRHASAIAVLSAACAFGAVAVIFQPTLQRGRVDWLGLGIAAWIGVCGTDAYHWAQSSMATCHQFNRAVVIVTMTAILMMGWNRYEWRQNVEKVVQEIREIRAETQEHRGKVQVKLDEIIEALETN